MNEEYCNIRIIGSSEGLARFRDQYIVTNDSGENTFVYEKNDMNLKLLDSNQPFDGYANLIFSSSGQLLLISIRCLKLYPPYIELVKKLQKIFPELIFHSSSWTYHYPGIYYSYTRIQRNKVCKGEDGMPIVDEIIEGYHKIWHEAGNYLDELEKILDSNVRNLRLVKLKQIIDRNPPE